MMLHPSYKDPAVKIAQRVDDLLSRMTLEEKAAQLCCLWERKVEFQDADGEFSRQKAEGVLGHGIGQIARISDYRGHKRWDLAPFRTIENAVIQANAVQRFLVEETRLGIPALFHDEISHGFLAGDATVFPMPPALGSTWDPTLVEQIFSAVASEARSRGTTVALGPTIDLMRDPRFGRSEEFFGEDAYHVSQMGIAAVRGLQGRARPLAEDRVFVTLKHFVHGSPLGGLNISPADVSERTMREHYLRPFEAIIAATDPAAIMPSYNEVLGVPSHGNKVLLEETGRQRLGFKGAYFGDYFGVQNLADQHHVASGKEDAAVRAIVAGVTADLPEGSAYSLLPQLVRDGRVDEALVDEAVRHVLSLKFEAGLFERPYSGLDAAVQTSSAASHEELAVRAAERAITLLKNDGTLPLSLGADLKLAVIGPCANEALFGGYSGDNPGAISILEGVRSLASSNVRVEHADGVWITAPDANGKHRSYSASEAVAAAENEHRIHEAMAVASRSDVVVLCLGDVPAVTREAVAYDLPGDRTSIGLWGQQDALVEAMLATGKPVVVVLVNGRPLAINRLAERANAILETWYLGQAGGAAVASAIFGRLNPGGKLPVSIPRSVGELPAYYNRHPSADINQYLDGPRQPLFPFGFGLTYTTFSISAPRLEETTIRADQSFWVEADVKNTGSFAGDEVVQLYIRDDVSSVPRPVLELRRFERLTLLPGEERTVRFEIAPDDLAFWDIDMCWVVEPGTFSLSVGNSSTSHQTVSIRVEGHLS